jgi:hypothetical protein
MRVKVYSKGQRDSLVADGEAADVVMVLTMWGTADLYEIYDGEKYEDAREFIVRMGGSVRAADGSMTPEERMYHEDLMDPIVHARNEMVVQWVARAIRLSHKPNYVPDLLAKNTAHEIIRLFLTEPPKD